MKRSIKAALLSGLIFPGIGHIYLKRYIHGTVLAACAATALYFIVSTAVATALEIAEQIESGAVPLDMVTITELASRRSSGAEQSMNLATIALVACWIIGVADSYRQGRARDKGEAAANKPGN